jgi:hypothetical protein
MGVMAGFGPFILANSQFAVVHMIFGFELKAPP